ncbi:MAG: 1-acyl-sn-glycerol-3-phosphate acyltransferase [Acholeplasmatales bacterium]|nr:1-acyl-sn-glycerol-3-phosphate acyltransferase [Acholeplasmatales bacterium]
MDEKQNETVNENEHSYDNGFHPKEVHLKPNYKLYRKSIWYKIWNKTLVYICKFLFFFPKFFVWGVRVKGKKNKKNIKSSMMVCNHAFPLDIFIILTSIPTKRVYVTTLESNMGFGIVSTFFRDGGAVPIPTDSQLLRRFNKETPEMIKKGYNVMFYPEAALIPYCDHIRPLLSGAFHYAYNSNKKIIPMVITFHKPKGLYKLFRKNKPCIHYNILEPYYMEDLGNKRLSLDKARDDIQKIISDYFIKNSDYYYDENGNRNETPIPRKTKKGKN